MICSLKTGNVLVEPSWIGKGIGLQLYISAAKHSDNTLLSSVDGETSKDAFKVWDRLKKYLGVRVTKVKNPHGGNLVYKLYCPPHVKGPLEL